MEYLLWLQGLRSDTLDLLLTAVTDLVTSPLLYALLALLYWCVDKQAAYFIALTVSGGSLVNQTLKNTFCIYRPWILNPAIKPPAAALEGATGYSFPSGHTQVASGAFLGLARWQKQRRWLVILCSGFTLLVMFTRNYLGVHTLADVLVSLAVSVVVLFLTEYLLGWVERAKNRDLMVFWVGILICVGFLAYTTLKPYPMDYAPDGSLLVDPAPMVVDCYMAAGCVFGFLVGWICERRFVCFTTQVSRNTKILRGGAGTVTLLVLVLLVEEPLERLHPYWGEFIFFALAFIMILFLYPAIFTAWERKHN